MPKSISSYVLYVLTTVLVVSLYLGNFAGLEKLQWTIDDLMYTFRGEETDSPEIVLVDIDDFSCETFGEWPWSYDVLADLVATCNSGNPNSILMNLDLSSRVSEDTSGNTQILANQVSWAENIVLTYDIALAEYSQKRMSKPRYLFKNSIQTESDLGILNNSGALSIRRPFLPSDLVSQYADGLGFIYTELDKDRQVRWVSLAANYDGYCYPSAALLSAALFLGFGPDDLVIYDDESIRFGEHSIPTDGTGRVFVNYSDSGTFTSYVAADLLEGRVEPALLKDKMVIIGVTRNGMEEKYETPVVSQMSRMELMANVIENIIHNNYISRLDVSTGFNLLVLLAFGAFCAVILPRVAILYRMVILFICLFIMVNLSFILFNSYSILTKSLYLGLEIILFMLVSPMLDDSNRPKMQSGFLGSLMSRFRKDETSAESRNAPDNIPVREVRDSEKESEFQETEHIDSGSIQQAILDSPPQNVTGNAAGTSTMDATPPPPPSPPPPPQPPELDPGLVNLEPKESKPKSSEIPPDPSVEKPIPVVSENQPPEKPPGVVMSSSPMGTASSDIDRLTNLGRYQVKEILGKGAMGTVFKGVDPAINRPVALKTIRLDFVTDQKEMEELRDRLAREARAAGKLSHPNIVTIYDIGAEANLHYIAMEFLEGQTLENLIKRKVQFSYKIIANIITQICMGLQYAHDQGIVHRDIKPANIMVLPDYAVKVMDFGIARVDSSSMTRTGIAMGTPNYIAPELLQGKSVDRRCDIFSLGVMIYELLTGSRPFKGENLTSLIYSIINDNPPQPSSVNENVPPIFDHIAMKALHKNPLERFQKASDLMGALSDFVGSFGGSKKVGL
jgi:serine/threonine-protein kinase